MRVSTIQIFRQALSEIQSQQAAVGKAQQQVATGRRILAPEDDPAGATRLLALDRVLAMTRRFKANADSALSRIAAEETVMNQVTNVLQRVRELALQGNSPTLIASDRQAISKEVEQRVDELLSLANAKDSNGEHLFSGFSTRMQPFARAGSGFIYNGDQGRRQLEIAPGLRLDIADSGSEVFQEIPGGNGVFSTFDDAANTGTGVIATGTVTDIAAYDRDTYTLLFPATSSAGPALVFNDGGAADTLSYTLSIDGTAVYTVDETGTPVSTLAGLAGVINDDTGTTGVRAYAVGAKLYLVRTAPSASPITITESMAGGSDGDADTVTGYFGAVLTGLSTPSVSSSLGPTNGGDYLVIDSTNNVETSGLYSDGGSIGFNGVQVSVSGAPGVHDRFTVSPSAAQDMFTTLQSLVTGLAIGDAGNGATQRTNAFNRTLTNLDQALDKALQVRARIGARLNTVDTQQSVNLDFDLFLQENISDIRDVDMADAVSRLAQLSATLQAAQQSFVAVQNLSLFNFL